jgi:hypothetical protein
MGRVERGLGLAFPCFVAPYVILLAILKSRATCHTEIHTAHNSEKEAKGGSNFWAYMKKILFLETKVAFVGNTFFSETWKAFCCLGVSILFPHQVAFIYLMAVSVNPIIEMLLDCDWETCSYDADDQMSSVV